MENLQDYHLPIEGAPEPKFSLKSTILSVGIIVFIIFIYIFVFTAPKSFPEGEMFKVEQGMNLRNVSLKLKQDNIIRSRFFFEAFVIMYGGDRKVMTADYLFTDKIPVYEVARRISKGDRRIAKVSVTIPEGLNNTEIANIFAKKLDTFDVDNFTASAIDKQGYLFPDTYYFFVTDTPKEVVKSMSTNFEKKVAPLRASFILFGKTEREIISMASILEKEARGDDDIRIISGILWRRISIGMPLQADAAPDTYKQKGLPEKPIGNPGLRAIKATINPEKSSYLYYIHDKNGLAHYARTLSEHNKNINIYLR